MGVFFVACRVGVHQMSDPRKKFRQMVSLKKKRFQEGGFDLDLAYITDRIIAFGFPAEGRESVFRNPMAECQRFFDMYHKDHYYVYNLCIEKDRQYKASKFYGRVAKFQWPDHNAPPLEMLPKFCEHAQEWLDQDEENVVAIHCKAGKGRTGVLICCLLLWCQQFADAEEAMQFYGEKRTHDGKGVTIPSQKRFIRYFHRTLKDGIPPTHTTSLLRKITLHHISTLEDHHVSIAIESNGTAVLFKKKGDKGLVYTFGEDSVTLDLGVVPVSGNTKVILYRPGKKKELLLHFWFHCHYVSDKFRMEKHEIDKAVADKTHKVFPQDFAIEVEFDPLKIYDEEASDEEPEDTVTVEALGSTPEAIAQAMRDDPMTAEEAKQERSEEEEEEDLEEEEEEEDEDEQDEY